MKKENTKDNKQVQSKFFRSRAKLNPDGKSAARFRSAGRIPTIIPNQPTEL